MASSQKKEEPPKKKSAASRIVTMDAIRNRHSADSDELAYYAGGSEHSGQQVLGPGKRKRVNEDSHSQTDGDALAHALQRAAQTISFVCDENNQPESPKLFGGVGYRLGSSDTASGTESDGNTQGANRRNSCDSESAALEPDDFEPRGTSDSKSNQDNRSQGTPESHVTISDENSIEILSDSRNLDSDDDEDEIQFIPRFESLEESGSPYVVISNNSSGEEGGDVYVNVTLYDNGFTVDDGPLKSYDDPTCGKLIESIQKGVFPSELLPDVSRRSVSVRVFDKRGQEFTPPPKPALKAFSGKGHLLGSPTPTVSPINNQAGPQSPINQEQQIQATNFDFSTDSLKTTLKIRLPDGTVLTFIVNLNCSMSDLRCYIIKARPDLEAQEFSLMTTFPRREFHDFNETIEQAGLKNACIVVQIT